MSDTRPELSKRNKYWIPRHRYYELKHFVMQYPEWRSMLKINDGYSKSGDGIKGPDIPDPTFITAEKRQEYRDNINMCELIARETDPVIGYYILKAVIDGISYDMLSARQRIPCSRETYYDLYHKFFWLLDAARK